jgi:Salmonella virulence plasmid 65kDa B protein
MQAESVPGSGPEHSRPGPGRGAAERPSASATTTTSTSDFLLSPPVVSLPKGGGAVRGIGEKFSANPVTGTGSMSIPIALSPGRGGFGPQLALSYDSGAGQSVFGLGWNLALPSILRKTDKGLPRYLDAEESDVFLLSGAEDLVPYVDATTGIRSIMQVRLAGVLYDVFRYRPRIEGLFARIERWKAVGPDSSTFWRTISRDNVTTWYGKDDGSRIVDPADPRRVYQWLLCQTSDDKGNVAAYQYIREDARNVDTSSVWETNRHDAARQSNRYLKRILYGNVEPFLPKLDSLAVDALPKTWMFEAVFDYGDHQGHVEDGRFPTPEPDTDWGSRGDAFSSHRAGFEVRTHRLCQRVLMFHNFPEVQDVGQGCLVRSTDFDYDKPDALLDASHTGYTTLRRVRQRSYKKVVPESTPKYKWRELPPVQFDYSQPVVSQVVQIIDPVQLENLPVGVQGPGYRWIDLDGEGLSGVLAEQAGGWFYKPNLGEGQFGAMRQVARTPTIALAAGSRTQFLDLSGNGQIDLVEFDGATPGFHERDRDNGWKRHVPFASLPNIDWQDPNLRFVDLTGDGHADALITEHEVFTTNEVSAPLNKPARRRTRTRGPALSFPMAPTPSS